MIIFTEMKRYIQYSAPHPGEMLMELYFEPLELSVDDAVDNLNISKSELTSIVNGRTGISATVAMKLAQEFNTTVQYWQNMQTNYDLSKQQNKQGFI